MKRIPREALIEFELTIMDMAQTYEIETVKDLERFSQMLHEHLETALQDHAEYKHIEDYDPQY